MNRFAFATLAGLTLAIGLTVASLAWRVIAFDPPASTLEAADPAIGFAFYDGLDQVLAGKPADALEQVVSRGFVDHGGADGTGQSTDQLVDQLLDFRQSFPGTRLVVNGIETASGTLIASIAPIEPSGATVAGLPLTMEPIAGGYEVLRVRNGEVTDRWSSGLPDIELHSFDDAAFTMGATFGKSIRLDRVELPDSGMVTMQIRGESVVMVESGSVRIHLRWFDASVGPQSDVLTLEAGQATRLPSWATIEVKRNDGGTARLLRVSIQQVAPGDPAQEAMTGGATSELLWSSNLPPLTGDNWSVTFGAMRLSAGATGALTTDERRLIVVCSDGSLDMTTQGGEIIALDEHYWPASVGNSIAVPTGHAASAEEAASVDLRSDTGAVLWLIALSGDDSLATPQPSASPTGV